MSIRRPIGRYCILTLILFSIFVASSVPTGSAPAAPILAMGSGEGSLHVNVTDNAGRPIQDANITITGNTSHWMTGADGSVLINNLSWGSYQINATKMDYLPNSTIKAVTNGSTTYVTLVITGGELRGFVYYALDNSPIGNATVEVAVGVQILSTQTASDGNYSIKGIPTGSYIVVVWAPGYDTASNVVQINASLPPTTLPPFYLVKRYGWIAGYVFDHESVVANASVSVTIDSIEHTVLSLELGDYYIPDVPAGNYTVTAAKEGYEDAVHANVIVVNGAGTDNINLSLVGKPARLSGTVSANITAGSVLIYGALVEILGTGLNATTGVQGHYEISGVPVGTYTIRTTAPGYLSEEKSAVVLARGSDIVFNVVLTPKPGQLMGTVRDAVTYEPISGYRVAISGPTQRETFTNDQGQYVFAGLTPGNYTLTVENKSNPKYSPYIAYNIEIKSEGVTSGDVYLQLVKKTLGGFIFGMDLPHSFMALAFIITIVILTVAVYLRLKRIQREERGAILEDELKEEPPEKRQ